MFNRVLTTMSIVLLLSASYAAAGALGLKPFLTAYDGNGSKVGIVHSIPPTGEVSLATVVFQINGYVFALNVNKAGLYGTSPAYFESPGCSGPPLVSASSAMIPNTVALDPKRTLYVADPGYPDENLAVKSGRSGPGAPCVAITEGAKVVHRTVPLLQLDDIFVAPFSIR